MKYYSQYGEENVILPFFSNKKKGKLIDIGAADGIKNSNTRYLIEQLEWGGILVEPHPTYYNELKKLYVNNSDIVLKNVAVYKEVGELPFYIYGYGSDEPAQVSTLSETFRDKVSKIYGNKYEKPVMVNVETLANIFKGNPDCDFLSVDCEGVDIEVLCSNDWNTYRPSLVCVEHSMPIIDLDSCMLNFEYKLHNRTHGNSFYIDNKGNIQ